MRGYYSEKEAKLQFRHENKYLIVGASAYELANRLSLTMDRDRHSNKHGEYHVRSLYFDDAFDSAVYTKMSGLKNRKKYRLRIYNIDPSKINLECKEKNGEYIYKRSAQIDVRSAEMLMQGVPLPIEMQTSAPVREFCAMMTERALRPTVIVDYFREAFVASYQTVRITLDKHLAMSSDSRGFFDKTLPTLPVLDQGNTILEVKFDDYFPVYYRDLITGTRGQHSALSKYIFCRDFTA